MTVLWELFSSFFTIGLFTFGGGYAMIPLVLETVVQKGWMTDSVFYQLLAVCESTPGPVAVNMATFVGSRQGGFWGSAAATLGVVLPSFIVILIIAALFRSFAKNRWVQAAFCGMRPVVLGLIASTGILLAVENVWNTFPAWPGTWDLWMLLRMVLIVAFSLIFQKIRKKKPSPLLLIGAGALCGLLIG